MLCVDCRKREGKTPNAKRCNPCYVKRYRLAHLGYGRYGVNGYKALVRDHYACKMCGKTKADIGFRNIEIHHIDGNGSRKPVKERNNDLSNLVTLCKPCHREVEIIRRGYANIGLAGRWAYHFNKCIACGKTDSPHSSKGLCLACYEKSRREYKTNYWREHYAKHPLTEVL